MYFRQQGVAVMKKRIWSRRFAALWENRAGNITVQSALLFGAVALSLSVLAAPLLNEAANRHAENRALGIDRVVTGSIEKSRTYTIRKSVLDK